MNPLRRLTTAEISQLERQQCYCENWNQIQVAENFSPTYIHQVHFSGKIELNLFETAFTGKDGVEKHSGIYKCRLHNATLRKNVYIHNVKEHIANVTIDENTCIENAGLITVDETSSFGNGTTVNVLNEAGGREVRIFDRLSAHAAYFITLYRHREKLIKNLNKIIDSHISSIQSNTGYIGKNVRIVNSGTIKNIKIGDNATIDGCARLENGSINSTSEAPVFIGSNVVLKDFILSSGCTVDQGAVITSSFIGQACQISKTASIHDSLLFANSQVYHSELCSVFGGPFTVTHHRSTLLIAGMFSFFNAGSGSNQSNHMYKLGPAHQGVFDRGTKFASNSYLLLPAKTGAFSMVKGDVSFNIDSSEFPFSYIIGDGKNCWLIPGRNFATAGTFRDIIKWEKRDGRKGYLLDNINFSLLNPFVMQQVVNGLNCLKKLNTQSEDSIIHYNGFSLKKKWITAGIKLYQLIIDNYAGQVLIKNAENRPSIETIGQWVDAAGLVSPQYRIENLLSRIENETIHSFQEIEEELLSAFNSYNEDEFAWVFGQIKSLQVKEILIRYIETEKEIATLLLADARQEFAEHAKISYGIDYELHREADFQAVKGDFNNDGFVQTIIKNSEKHIAAAENILNDRAF